VVEKRPHHARAGLELVLDALRAERVGVPLDVLRDRVRAAEQADAGGRRARIHGEYEFPHRIPLVAGVAIPGVVGAVLRAAPCIPLIVFPGRLAAYQVERPSLAGWPTCRSAANAADGPENAPFTGLRWDSEGLGAERACAPLGEVTRFRHGIG
jgi:hypothetical protein